MSAERRESAGHAELLDVLRLASFRDYTISRAASGIATGLLQALILWQVYAISASTLSLGIVGLVAFAAAFVSSLVGGAIVDSYDRRTVLFASQIVAGAASLSMLLAILSQHASLGLVYVLVLVTGVAASLEFPARYAVLPSIVPPALFNRALTVNSAVTSLTSVTGPAVGGVLIAMGGIGAAYAGHVVLLAIAIASLVPLRLPTER
jgi:MFS family permease